MNLNNKDYNIINKVISFILNIESFVLKLKDFCKLFNLNISFKSFFFQFYNNLITAV